MSLFSRTLDSTQPLHSLTFPSKVIDSSDVIRNTVHVSVFMSATLFRHPMTLPSTAMRGGWLGLVETLSYQKGYYLLALHAMLPQNSASDLF